MPRSASTSTVVVPAGRPVARDPAQVDAGARRDRLFLLIDAPARKKLDGDDLFNRLAVAREHRVVDLPYATTTQLGAAVAFNSVLSIPYALDGIGKSLTER
jgi:hypothetical protein